MPDVQSYRVDWFVHDRTIHSNVTVRIFDGWVVEVAPGTVDGAVDLGPVALVDGLVNAHTHLEFSRLKQPIPTSGRFTDWIRSVVKYRADFAGHVDDAISDGLEESLRAGTTLIGEIATVGWSTFVYENAQVPSVVFQELLGSSPQRVDQQRQVARSHALSQWAQSRPGLSPHAPYSTHLDLVTEAVNLATEFDLPLAMHLGETTAELELLKQGTGEFRELLTDFGIWNGELFRASRTPLDFLKVLAQAPRSLIVHGNYLTDEELAFIADNPQMTLVYCPRTHSAFGHSPHPWKRLIELGGRLAIGTDSRASNPDLSLFAELQFLAKQFPEVSHVELLAYGSLEGRRALTGNPENQTIPAHFNVIRSDQSHITDPTRDLFGERCRVSGTMINGHWLWLDSK